MFPKAKAWALLIFTFLLVGPPGGGQKKFNLNGLSADGMGHREAGMLEISKSCNALETKPQEGMAPPAAKLLCLYLAKLYLNTVNQITAII